MNKELLLLIRKPTNTIFEQTRSHHREKLDYKFKKPIDSFAFFSPINTTEERKWLLAFLLVINTLVVTSFEAINSVYNVSKRNKSFSVSTLSLWTPNGDEGPINKLNELLEL